MSWKSNEAKDLETIAAPSAYWVKKTFMPKFGWNEQ